MTVENKKENSGNNVTELVFIIDRSGSMCGMEDDTIGGFNSMINEQKAIDGKVFVSTVLFANHSKVLHDRVEIEKIEPMNRSQYSANGGTALLDAIGDAIHHISNIHKYARPEDVPEHTVFVITTDGMENASIKYGSDKIKNMIKHQEEKYGWEFMFVAANIDAVETAEEYGIRRERAANYNPTSEGTQSVYAAMSCVVGNIRSNAHDARTDETWKKNLR